MKKIKLGTSDLEVSQIAVGCMRIARKSIGENAALIHGALDNGMNFFDHADVYAGGKCEETFAQVLKTESISREKVIIQSKCGIRKGFFDFSKDHILSSVNGSLKRLDTDYLDVLLLHRPDTLMEPEEVASAFDTLHKSGKVRYFGVSNQNPMQIELLKKFAKQEIVANQIQLSITNTGMIDSGITVNMKNDNSIDRDGSILEYCRLHDITIQPWSPFQYGFFEGVFIDSPKYTELNKVMDEVASIHNISKSTLAIAWLLRHPANMQPILGSTNVNRVIEISQATEVTLSREEWYRIYISAGNILP